MGARTVSHRDAINNMRVPRRNLQSLIATGGAPNAATIRTNGGIKGGGADVITDGFTCGCKLHGGCDDILSFVICSTGCRWDVGRGADMTGHMSFTAWDGIYEHQQHPCSPRVVATWRPTPSSVGRLSGVSWNSRRRAAMEDLIETPHVECAS